MTAPASDAVIAALRTLAAGRDFYVGPDSDDRFNDENLVLILPLRDPDEAREWVMALLGSREATPSPGAEASPVAPELAATCRALMAENARLHADLAEMTRRRDEWRKKAEGYDEVRLALRKKVGAPWPPNMSRAIWAALAKDEKKRADDAEAEVARLRATLEEKGLV